MTLIPGDGVGPEIMDSTQEVLLQMGAKVDPLDLARLDLTRKDYEDGLAKVDQLDLARKDYEDGLAKVDPLDLARKDYEDGLAKADQLD